MPYDTQPGQPFRPWKLFHGALVPEQLQRCQNLSQGAKLTWAQLARHTGQDGRCFPSQATLAANLGRKERQVRNYLTELKRNGLLRATRTGLNEPNSYELLWHPIFEDAKPHDPRDRQSNAAQDRQFNAAPDRQPSAAPLKEEESQIKSKIDRSIKLPYPEEEIRDLIETVQSFSYADSRPVEATQQILGGMHAVMASYCRSPRHACAELYRVWRYIQRRPDLWPKTPHWFRATLNNAFLARVKPTLDIPGVQPAPIPPQRADTDWSKNLVATAAAKAKAL